MARTHIIRKEDLTDYAIKNLQLWDSLTDDRDADEIEVEVRLVTKDGKAANPKRVKL